MQMMKLVSGKTRDFMGESFKSAHEETYGPERLPADLPVHGVVVGMHRIKRIRKILNLHSKQRKIMTTTNSNHMLPVAEKFLEQNFVADSPNRIFMTLKCNIK
jgi:putative transposase